MPEQSAARWSPKARPQAASLWSLRESISESQKQEGASIKHDISVPVAAIPDFIAKADAGRPGADVPGARAVSFGHLGDGNLHFNFSAPRSPATIRHSWRNGTKCSTRCIDVVKEFGGSISAEHGIGTIEGRASYRYKSHAGTGRDAGA